MHGKHGYVWLAGLLFSLATAALCEFPDSERLRVICQVVCADFIAECGKPAAKMQAMVDVRIAVLLSMRW